jgi:hypothetical protein
MANVCAGSKQNIPNRAHLTCFTCKENYDIKCANVSFQRFYHSMTADHKKAWICPSCRCKTPKSDNRNQTIIYREDNRTPNDEQEISNVTIRRTAGSTSNTSISSNDLSILGDTITTHSPNQDEEINTIANPKDNTLTLENINTLLELHLQINTKSIISEIKITVKKEIEDAITECKKEIRETTGELQLE